jgi:hypothetical protein
MIEVNGDQADDRLERLESQLVRIERLLSTHASARTPRGREDR